jgi:hypothetical protein
VANEGQPGHPISSYPLILICVILALGVAGVQFKFGKQADMVNTGNRDLCFYNDGCYRTVGNQYDYPGNNVISNVAYVVFGACYIIIVAVQECSTRVRA